MRTHLASALLVLAPVALFNTASADDHAPAKRPVDFTAVVAHLNGSTTSLGKTGVVVKIQSAAIAKDGTITVRATIVDADGIPLDRLGVATKGPVSMSFIAAYIPSGQLQYVSYTTSVSKPSILPADAGLPSQTQAANDSGGTFATNAIGDYTYTFKTKAPVTFDPTVTNSIGVSAVCPATTAQVPEDQNRKQAVCPLHSNFRPRRIFAPASRGHLRRKRRPRRRQRQQRDATPGFLASGRDRNG